MSNFELSPVGGLLQGIQEGQAKQRQDAMTHANLLFQQGQQAIRQQIANDRDAAAKTAQQRADDLAKHQQAQDAARVTRDQNWVSYHQQQNDLALGKITNAAQMSAARINAQNVRFLLTNGMSPQDAVHTAMEWGKNNPTGPTPIPGSTAVPTNTGPQYPASPAGDGTTPSPLGPPPVSGQDTASQADTSIPAPMLSAPTTPTQGADLPAQGVGGPMPVGIPSPYAQQSVNPNPPPDLGSQTTDANLSTPQFRGPIAAASAQGPIPMTEGTNLAQPPMAGNPQMDAWTMQAAQATPPIVAPPQAQMPVGIPQQMQPGVGNVPLPMAAGKIAKLNADTQRSLTGADLNSARAGLARVQAHYKQMMEPVDVALGKLKGEAIKSGIEVNDAKVDEYAARTSLFVQQEINATDTDELIKAKTLIMNGTGKWVVQKSEWDAKIAKQKLDQGADQVPDFTESQKTHESVTKALDASQGKLTNAIAYYQNLHRIALMPESPDPVNDAHAAHLWQAMHVNGVLDPSLVASSQAEINGYRLSIAEMKAQQAVSQYQMDLKNHLATSETIAADKAKADAAVNSYKGTETSVTSAPTPVRAAPPVSGAKGPAKLSPDDVWKKLNGQ